MKSLFESLLDDFDTVSASSTIDIKKEIKQFLKDNYKKSSNFKISRKPNDDGYYEVDCSKYTTNIEVTNKNIVSLTNNLFVFVNVKCDFCCNGCNNLTSLEGAPQKVKGAFDCSGSNIISLKGAPKEVGGDFQCVACPNLTSHEDAPKNIGGNIYSNFPDFY